MVIISGGGKELGGESEVLEMEIQRLAKELQIRIGRLQLHRRRQRGDPHGYIFPAPRAHVTPPSRPRRRAQPVGHHWNCFMEEIYSVGTSKFVSYGNRIDVDEADLLAYLERDPQTRVIAHLHGRLEGRSQIPGDAPRWSPNKTDCHLQDRQNTGSRRASVSHTGFLRRQLQRI